MKQHLRSQPLATTNSCSGVRSQAPAQYNLQAAPIQRQAPPPPTLEVPWADTNVDSYDKLTGFGNKESKEGNRNVTGVDYIVMHRTGTENLMQSIDAHYEVDMQGNVYRGNTRGKRLQHAGHKWQLDPKNKFGQYAHMNARSLGIEFAGAPVKLATRPTSGKDTTKMKALRDEINGLELSPPFKARLMGMTDAKLYETVKSVEYTIYDDISPEQKMAAYELYRNLKQEYPNAQFVAHEHVAPKALGEGENITDFLTGMEGFNRKLGEMQQKAPTFWDQRYFSLSTKADEARQAMSEPGFYENFYATAALCTEIHAFTQTIDQQSTVDLISNFADPASVTGMELVLKEYKRFMVYKELMKRKYTVEVTVSEVDDQYGEEEEIYLERDAAATTSSQVVKKGGTAKFVLPVSDIITKIGPSGTGVVNLVAKEDDSPFGSDNAVSLAWKPNASAPWDGTQRSGRYTLYVHF